MGLKVNPDKNTNKTEAQIEKTPEHTTEKSETENIHLESQNKPDKQKSNKSGTEHRKKPKQEKKRSIDHNLVTTYHPRPMPPYCPYWQPCWPPIAICKWAPYFHFSNTIRSFQIPVIINPNQILAPVPNPYIGMVAPPVLSPLVQYGNGSKIPHRYEPLVNQTDVPDSSVMEYVINEITDDNCDDSNFSSIIRDDDDEKNNNNVAIDDKDTRDADVAEERKETTTDPLEGYLKLPKNLFPKARSIKFNPNLMIDEICKLPNILQHTPWILDLEFGIPRAPTTRVIPAYNVKFNSIHCKNTPDAIHPGFDSCGQDFKEMFLFYYDSIISTWYTGYVIWNNDNSIDNFQKWLMLPLQLLGMCWS